MSYLLGLTGSIGMGKTTTCEFFAKQGCVIWDADLAVHNAYGPGGAAVGAIKAFLPQLFEENKINREKLRQTIIDDPTVLPKIEGIIHPLVQQNRQKFILDNSAPILVFDIPLLYELNIEKDFDAIACVFTAPDMQKKRVMARPGMNKRYFDMVLNKQFPAADKVGRSDYVIDTSTLETAQTAVEFIMKDIGRKLKNA